MFPGIIRPLLLSRSLAFAIIFLIFDEVSIDISVAAQSSRFVEIPKFQEFLYYVYITFLKFLIMRGSLVTTTFSLLYLTAVIVQLKDPFMRSSSSMTMNL